MSSESFKVGEIAICHNPGSLHHGREVTILSPLKRMRLWDRGGNAPRLVEAHAVETSDGARKSPTGRPWAIEPRNLRKRRPPRQDKGRWEDVPFYVPPSRRTVPA